MILTNEERQKFIAYCDQVIESSRLIIEQMKKLPVSDTLIGREKHKQLGYAIVSSDLKSMELM